MKKDPNSLSEEEFLDLFELMPYIVPDATEEDWYFLQQSGKFFREGAAENNEDEDKNKQENSYNNNIHNFVYPPRFLLAFLILIPKCYLSRR
jgi:hypothetical protein